MKNNGRLRKEARNGTKWKETLSKVEKEAKLTRKTTQRQRSAKEMDGRQNVRTQEFKKTGMEMTGELKTYEKREQQRRGDLLEGI